MGLGLAPEGAPRGHAVGLRHKMLPNRHFPGPQPGHVSPQTGWMSAEHRCPIPLLLLLTWRRPPQEALDLEADEPGPDPRGLECSLLLRLLVAVLRPLLLQLDGWLRHGELPPGPAGFFVVAGDAMLPSLDVDALAASWDASFALARAPGGQVACPAVLRPLADQVLQAGRAARLLQLAEPPAASVAAAADAEPLLRGFEEAMLRLLREATARGTSVAPGVAVGTSGERRTEEQEDQAWRSQGGEQERDEGFVLRRGELPAAAARQPLLPPPQQHQAEGDLELPAELAAAFPGLQGLGQRMSAAPAVAGFAASSSSSSSSRRLPDTGKEERATEGTAAGPSSERRSRLVRRCRRRSAPRGASMLTCPYPRHCRALSWVSPGCPSTSSPGTWRGL